MAEVGSAGYRAGGTEKELVTNSSKCSVNDTERERGRDLRLVAS